MKFTYDAAGNKLRKETFNNANVSTYKQDYVGRVEYVNDVIEAIYNSEGRAVWNGTTWRYEYNLTDHLGNVRAVISDLDNDKILDITTSSTTNEIINVTSYYPFGMVMPGTFSNNTTTPDTRYQYNGKEFNSDLGLNLLDYGARWYDPAVGRFTGLDPLADNMAAWSPFAYGFNNPLKFTDPTGMAPDDIIIRAKKGVERAYVERTFNYLQSLTDDKLSIDKTGKVTIAELQNGEKNEGSSLVRDLIGSTIITTVTNDVEGVEYENEPLSEKALLNNAYTIAESPGNASNGVGSASKILFDADVKASFINEKGSKETSKANSVLAHELIHADNNRGGTREMNKPPSSPQFKGNREEEKTTNRENIIRREQKQNLRSNGSH